MIEQPEKWAVEHLEQLLEETMALIRIRSVSEPSAGAFPYGEGCARVLEHALTLAGKMGFETENHEYHCGSVLLRGKTDQEIGVFVHLDVVAEGSGWNQPPYQPVLKDGWLYGRGSADNKGPAMTALYALACLKEQGFWPRHTIRLFLGCSEENGMADIDYYLAHHAAPVFSFTPDAAFSVCFGEKGMIEAEFSTEISGRLIDFSAGVSSNAVPSEAFADLRDTQVETVCAQIDEQTAVEETENGVRLYVRGKAAHAAFPEGSDNAAVKLAALLVKLELVEEREQEKLRFLSDALADYYGTGMGLDCADKISGPLTIIAGTTRMQSGRIWQTVNIRYPIHADADALHGRLIKKAADCGWQVEWSKTAPASFVSADSEPVREMVKICEEVWERRMEPYTMGGGTYAKHLPNAVGYGPGISGQKKPGPDGHGGGHQPDECIEVETLCRAMIVYIRALQRLDEIIE